MDFFFPLRSSSSLPRNKEFPTDCVPSLWKQLYVLISIILLHQHLSSGFGVGKQSFYDVYIAVTVRTRSLRCRTPCSKKCVNRPGNYSLAQRSWAPVSEGFSDHHGSFYHLALSARKVIIPLISGAGAWVWALVKLLGWYPLPLLDSRSAHLLWYSWLLMARADTWAHSAADPCFLHHLSF